MGVSSDEFEQDENGNYWVPEDLLTEFAYNFISYPFFVPNGFLKFRSFVEALGQQIFPNEWTGREERVKVLYSFDIGQIDPKELILAGSRLFVGRESLDQDGQKRREVLVKPMSMQEAEENQAGLDRMHFVLSVLRQGLYAGDVKAMANPAKPEEILPYDWAGQLWEMVTYNEPAHAEDSGFKYSECPHIYLDKCYLDKIVCSNIESNELPSSSRNLTLSPYIEAAIHLSRKYELSESSNLTIENLEDMIGQDWPKNCGTPSKNKIRNLARMMRWPSQETGGNRPSK